MDQDELSPPTPEHQDQVAEEEGAVENAILAQWDEDGRLPVGVPLDVGSMDEVADDPDVGEETLLRAAGLSDEQDEEPVVYGAPPVRDEGGDSALPGRVGDALEAQPGSSWGPLPDTAQAHPLVDVHSAGDHHDHSMSREARANGLPVDEITGPFPTLEGPGAEEPDGAPEEPDPFGLSDALARLAGAGEPVGGAGLEHPDPESLEVFAADGLVSEDTRDFLALLEDAAYEAPALADSVRSLQRAWSRQSVEGLLDGFEDALAQHGAAGVLFAVVGRALLSWGATEEARAVLVRGLEQGGLGTDVLEALAVLELSVGNPEAARRVLGVLLERCEIGRSRLVRVTRLAIELGEFELAGALIGQLTGEGLAGEQAAEGAQLTRRLQARSITVKRLVASALAQATAVQLQGPTRALTRWMETLPADRVSPEAHAAARQLARVSESLKYSIEA